MATEADETKWKQTYVYGGLGERLSMTYLPAYDHDNGWEPDAGAGGAEPGVSSKTLYYLQDVLGSVVGLEASDGRVSARYHYDEFGVPLDGRKLDPNWPGPDNWFGYTGLGYDVYSGLTYARARYYQAEIGRFISEDAYEGNLRNPQSLNLYAYVRNNPLKFIDPSGYDAIIITNPNLAYNFGHTSAIIQASNNEWYYFYWGDNNVQLIKVDDEKALKSLDDFNYWGANKKVKIDRKEVGLAGFSKGGYQYATYIKGDFTSSLKEAEELAKRYPFEGENEGYNLLTKNCLIVTETLLREGMLAQGTKAERLFDTNLSPSLDPSEDFSGIIPNIARERFEIIFYNNAFTYDDYIKQLKEKREYYTDLNWFEKIIYKAKYHLFRINIPLGESN